MKYKLILLLSALLNINAVQAQWHFTANIDYYCNGENHDLEVYQWQIQLAQQLSATAFNTKQDCEAARQSVNIFVGVSECWVRITPSPCTGNDVGGVGGGVGGNLGIGGSSQGSASPHNSIAIGDSYFAPTGTQVIANTGQELEIKLEAMSKSFNSAVNGVKTGDQAFDDTYRRQVRQMYERKEETDNTDYYVGLQKVRDKEKERSALEKVREKEEENEHIDNLETSKYKEGIQEHLNESLQNNVSIKDNIVVAIPELVENYKVGAMGIKEGEKRLSEIPGAKSEALAKINNEVNTIDGFGNVLVQSLIGNKEGVSANFKKIKVVDQTKDWIGNAANTVTQKWGINFKKGVEIVEYHGETSEGLFKRILNYNKSILNNDPKADQHRKELDKYIYKQSTNTPKP